MRWRSARRASGSRSGEAMDDHKLLGIGIAGAAVAALACFTPVLVAFLAAVGLSAVVGWLDYVLLPAFAAFVGIVIYAVVRERRRRAQGSATEGGSQRRV